MDFSFEDRLKELGLTLTPEQISAFERYYRLLTEWNQVMNLTAITEKKDVYEKHFIDSLAIVKATDVKKVKTLIDIGTGAGFPGLPLKIAFPHLNVTLLDSLNKRIRFLDTVVGELNLQNVNLIHGRAEDFSKKREYREKYDLCVSRAVANLATLSEYCLPYVKVRGMFISYKSGDVEEEVVAAERAIQILGGKNENLVKFCLPESNISRSFVCIRKMKQTERKYPRKAGLPGKEPLL